MTKLENELTRYKIELSAINDEIDNACTSELLIKRSRIENAIYITELQIADKIEFISNGIPGQASAIRFK